MESQFHYCILPRSVAKARGIGRYLTHTRCKEGHEDVRQTASGSCATCMLANSRKWRSENIEYNINRKREWSASNRERVSRYTKSYYMENRDELNRKSQEWRDKNKDWFANYREANSDARKEYNAQWRRDNPHAGRAQASKRRAVKQRRMIDPDCELTIFVQEEAADLCAVRKEMHGMEWEVDHMVPLLAKNASGLHTASNLQVIPQWLNRSKGNRLLYTEPFEWVKGFGG